MSMLADKVYRRCEQQCMKCKQCREFEKVVEEIDLKERSDLDRRREADKILRRGEL